MSEIKPQKDHYIDEDQLGDEYCHAVKCNACFSTDIEGELKGYGCEGRDDFLDENEELVLDFQEAYFLIEKKSEKLHAENAELKSKFEIAVDSLKKISSGLTTDQSKVGFKTKNLAYQTLKELEAERE